MNKIELILKTLENAHFYCGECLYDKTEANCNGDYCRQQKDLAQQIDALYTERAGETDRIYPCDKCGKLRTKAEGGTCFSLCDECWDKAYPMSQPVPPVEPDLMLTEIIPTREPFPHTISQAYTNGWTDCRHLVIRKIQPVIDGLRQENDLLKKSVSELVEAMHRYEIDVEVEAPITHRKMMERAEKALRAVKE